MSTRYAHTKIKKNKDGRRVLKPTIYPRIPIRDTDIFIYPKYGDRLDIIAFKHYGDTSLWWIIAKANDIDKGTIRLDPTKQIRIPIEIEPILIQLKAASY
ncbi:hypothetical protein CL614_07885 [archaeon]|nr:hypothetical protein [archaeon]